ncbi:amidohydrolase family protein [Natrinema soli]|uniref:Amidohydrolase family protein n=1 Tax=Natrinema soli TaxID=1930624 RepID=A0ABD5SKD6_9EURY|nr:amidohydrolase family protein [Natrinema soli]
MPSSNSQSRDRSPQAISPIVDAHVHLLPDRILAAIHEWFQQEVSWTLPSVTSGDICDYLAARDGAVCFPYAHKPDVARSMNNMVAETIEPLDHVVGLATVHADDNDPECVIRDGLTAGLAGVKLHCPVQEFPPSDQRLDPVYELAVERELPVVIHASSHPFYRDSDLVGPAATEDVLERFPSLRLCVPHLGLFETDAFLDLADQYENIIFDTAVAVGDQVHDLIGVREGEMPIDRLREYTDQIMFGTDYPTYPSSITETELIDDTQAAFPQGYEHILCHNAVDFFDINLKTQ